LRLALETLRPREREALTLRFEADLSLRDVAAALGLDEDAARKRVSRALEKLRQAMGA
jgi:RNA polymerase sigma-70 factor (ECF subfamily)